jgi:hypothetical protein
MAVCFCGTATPASPDRRGSRDSGQTANMVLAVVQIETRPPEQRVRRALQCADYWPAATAFKLALRMSASNCRGQRTATGGAYHVRAPAAINATIRAAPARVPSASPRHRHHGARNSCTETGDGPAARRRCPHRQGLAGPHCAIGGRSGSGATSPRIAPATWSWRSEGRMVRWAPRFFLTKCRIDESGRAARCGCPLPCPTRGPD